MDFEDLCNIKLSLSLGCVDKSENYFQTLKFDKIFSSRTLLSSEEQHDERDHVRGEETQKKWGPQASSVSGVSSYSDDFQESSKLSDDQVCARKKLRLTKQQSLVLECSFKEQGTLTPKKKQELAHLLNLRPRQIEVWFQNRRARIKMKKNEVDCELLKKYRDTLAIENRRLRKELQELKTRTLSAQPEIYMQLQYPATAATLSLCPCCENIYNIK